VLDRKQYRTNGARERQQVRCSLRPMALSCE
jgi:hypothetical protein